MKVVLHCSWPGQVEWWRETLQLHSKELLCQFKGGTEADECSFLPPLPPCPALWRKLWLWDFELEILHVHVRENSEKISWGTFTPFLWYFFWVFITYVDSEDFSHVILIVLYHNMIYSSLLYYHHSVMLSWLLYWYHVLSAVQGQKSLDCSEVS